MDLPQQHPRRVSALRTLLAAVVVSLLTVGQAAAQQTGSITGRVTDSQSGQPIASVQVFISGLNLGVLSQQNGRYLLVNVPPGAHQVTVQRIGYREMTAEVTVGAGATVVQDFVVTQEALQLQEVLVTGTAGGTQRRAVGNAIARVDASDVVATRPISNLQELMQARTPGLAFTRIGGQIGEASVIQVRGVSSFGLGSQPLIYIDGVRMDNSTSLGPDLPNTGAGRNSAGALNDINPNDIESIEIIKGPAAATLYGTEASAGVIQIITKRGLPGAPQFDAQVTEGQNFILDPHGMIGDQYHCRNTTTGFPGSAPCTAANERLESYNIIDLEEANGYGSPVSNGLNQKYNLSVRGGVDAVNYFVAGDYTDADGVRSTNWNHQWSGRSNIGVVVGEGLNVDLSVGYTSGKTRFATGLIESGGLWPHMMWALGWDGHDQNGNPGGFNLARGYLSYTPEEFDIPEATRDFTRVNGSITISHSPFSWLDHRLTVGIDRGEEEDQTLFPRDINGSDGPFGDASLGQVTVLRPINTQVTVDYGVSGRYSPTDAFTFTTSAGMQYFASEYNRIETVGLVFAAPALRSVGAATSTTGSQSFRQNKSLGFYVQEELGWNDRLFITGALRADDNSAFGSSYDAAYYPKVSATWVLSEESFWNVGFINSLRLRGAWGKAGRQPDTFAAVTLFNTSVGSGGVAAVTPQTLGNDQIGPEVGQELELGFDMALFSDRVSTEFTYFKQKTTDALVSVPLAPSEGFPGSQADNLGQLDNWGYEVSVNGRAFQSGDWALDLGAQMTYTMNEIKDLGGRPASSALRLGMPYPSERTTHLISGEFSPVTGLPTNLMCDAGISWAPEGADPTQYRLDTGGATVPCADIRSNSSTLSGPTFSPWHWSGNATITWRDVQVFGLVDGEHDRWLNDFDISCRHDYCGFANSRASLMRDDPLFVQSSTLWFAYPTDRRYAFAYDASYIRVRELGLRYQIPSSLLEYVRADRASLSFSARNLWYLWRKNKDVSGVPIPSQEIANPSSESAFSLFQWPPLTTFEASLRVSF
jgi:TonB-linked SusC/RagA family outer membrane protein